MKFTATAAMGLFSLASARVNMRDLETTLRVMNNVLDQMVVVDSTISSFRDATDLPAVSTVGAKMISIINASDAEILVMEPVQLADAMAFQPLSDKLNAQGDQLLANVESKVPLFGRASVCPQLHTAVSNIGAGVVKLMNDVSDKFPQEGRQNNANTIQHFTDSFAAVIAKLKACADVNNAGQGVAGGSTSAVIATTSAVASAPTPASTTVAVATAASPAGYTAKTGATGTGSVSAPSVSGAPRNGTDGNSKTSTVVTAGAPIAGIAKGAAAALLVAFLL